LILQRNQTKSMFASRKNTCNMAALFPGCRDEHGHGFGFKLGGFSALWWIWSYIFCLTGFGLDLDLIILFYTSSQLSVLFQSCRLLHSACSLFICCSGVSYIYRKCTPCLYLDHMRSIDARYKPALLCIMSSKLRN